MTKKIETNELFSEYFERWIKVYKEGAIRKVTMNKYLLALTWVKKLVPDLKVSQMDRTSYQRLLNEYAKHHERQTTMDFHHQLKGAILDAVDDGLIQRDPTRKAIIKGKAPREKKPKYLSQFELLKCFGENTIVVVCTNNLIIECIRLLDYKLFDNFLVNKGIIGSIIFSIIMIVIEYTLIKISKSRFSILFGK